jgi:hypothetical protein
MKNRNRPESLFNHGKKQKDVKNKIERFVETNPALDNIIVT